MRQDPGISWTARTIRAVLSFIFRIAAAPLFLAACGGIGGHDAGAGISGLRLIGEQRIALHQPFLSTTVGGLSGIDYDRSTGNWILISDDRSDINPARFYTARLDYDANRFSGVELRGVTVLKQADGTPYPNRKAAARDGARPEVADLEAIRIDPRDQSVWYTSEGDKSLGLDPFIRQAGRDGGFVLQLPLPDLFRMTAGQTLGPRNNDTLEGLAFSADAGSLWAAMEAPLYQDGPPPSVGAGGLVRITEFDRGGRVRQQIAYPVEKIPAAPGPGMAANNGVSEILAVDAHRFLVLERSGVQAGDGSYRNFIRIYEMDITGATDISGMPSLQDAAFRPARKRLVLDLGTLGLPKLDNIEGMAWGPDLPDGHRSLVLVSDNNFNPAQVTQLLAFKVMK